MLLRRKEVLRLTSLSQSALCRLMNEPRFPRPVRISPRCVAWRSEEVQDWIDRLPPPVERLAGGRIAHRRMKPCSCS